MRQNTAMRSRFRPTVPYASIAAVVLSVGMPHAQGRQTPTAEWLCQFADLVVVAKLSSTVDASKDVKDVDCAVLDQVLIPVLTRVNIVFVLKGTHEAKQVVIVHSRLHPEFIFGGPLLMNLEAQGTYVLFLKKRQDGRYQPASGLFDSRVSAKRTDPELLLDPFETHLRLPSPATPAGRETLWAKLISKDPITVYRTIETLCRSPGDAVRLFEQHLKPVPRANAQRLAEALRNLDNNEFPVRDQASRDLAALGEAAEPALRGTMAAPPSEEVRQRVRRLLNRLEGSDRWRRSRALELLEYLADPQSRRLLTALARGAPHAILTVQAQAALRRLTSPGRCPSPHTP
jgi:hypothetical protein